MDGFYSLNVSLHETCKQNQKDKNNVCSQCYGKYMIDRYPNLKKQLDNNYNSLSAGIISDGYARLLADQIILKPKLIGLRFNSIGELINKNHCINLQKISSRLHGDIPVTIWTKRSRLLFSAVKKPCFNVIYSTMKLNAYAGLYGLDHRISGTFNVYDDIVALKRDYATAKALFDKSVVHICRGSCKDCMLCYPKNYNYKNTSSQYASNRFIIFELAKKEQNKIKRREKKEQVDIHAV